MDDALRKNVEAQRDRLLDQLKDLDELREELDAGEYEAMKADTIAQLKEFEASLAKMVEGNMTLQSELDATRMAVRAAISEAFKTPEVRRLRHQPCMLNNPLLACITLSSSLLHFLAGDPDVCKKGACRPATATCRARSRRETGQDGFCDCVRSGDMRAREYHVSHLPPHSLIAH